METLMDSTREPLPAGSAWRRAGIAALAMLLLAPAGLLSGCSMTPEDKAFYGRGWINPDELDQDEAPPRAFTDPTYIQPHMMGPGEY